MVYRFLMLSDEQNFFRREFLVDAEATFLELNNFILDAVGYSRGEMSTFYVCDSEWNMGQEITLMDMGFGSSEYDTYLMESTRLEELVERRGDRLFFVFDMLSERGFYLEIAETLPGEYLDAPKVIFSEGKAPEQMSSIEVAESRSIGGAQTTAYGLDEDIFDEDGLDLDDLDGLSELDADTSDLY